MGNPVSTENAKPPSGVDESVTGPGPAASPAAPESSNPGASRSTSPPASDTSTPVAIAQAPTAPAAPVASIQAPTAPGAAPSALASTTPAPKRRFWRTKIYEARRKVIATYHSARCDVFAPGWKAQLLQTVAQVVLVALPAIGMGWKYGFYYTGAWALFWFYRSWAQSTPRALAMLNRNDAERQLQLGSLIEMLLRNDLAPAEVRAFQQRALQLIVSYVRDHRSDLSATEIFANLLVEDGVDMRVVARDRQHRVTSLRHPKKDSIAWKAVSTGEIQFTGDVYHDYPTTLPGKPYRSILAIPVVLDGKVLGTVSIDSSREHHFDGAVDRMAQHLLPFVTLLSWTLSITKLAHRCQAAGMGKALEGGQP